MVRLRRDGSERSNISSARRMRIVRTVAKWSLRTLPEVQQERARRAQAQATVSPEATVSRGIASVTGVSDAAVDDAPADDAPADEACAA